MASLKDIRKRIQSVKNTRQITRAMKMVAAAKLRRAQENIQNSRAYAYRIYSLLISLTKMEEVSHPLLEHRAESRIRLIVLAGDRGLCGSFNSSVLKKAEQFALKRRAEGVEVVVDVIGKKAFEYFKNRPGFGTWYEGLLGKASYATTSEVAKRILAEFQEGNFDAAYLVYNEFKSAIQQRVIVEKLVPISVEVPEGVTSLVHESENEAHRKAIFEPGKQALLDALVPRHFKVQLFRSVLESVASEHGARMSAMENATKNASEMIDSLTLEYNKARQAAITKELSEIVGGMESMA
jgi:F-type H+-transporting ATPase subunit gamma